MEKEMKCDKCRGYLKHKGVGGVDDSGIDYCAGCNGEHGRPLSTNIIIINPKKLQPVGRGGISGHKYKSTKTSRR